MPTLGTISWANQTDGTLSTLGKLTMLQQEVQRQIGLQWRRITGRQNMQVDRIDLDNIVIPDSELAVSCLALCESVAPTSLLNHSLRTYYWGSIVAMQDGLKLDAELFYIMAVLHDIGLTDTYNSADGHSQCFAVEGGRVAGKFIRDAGKPEQARIIEEAIIRHLCLHVPVADGVEQHLLPTATTMDVVGARLREIKSETIQAVLEQYPRLSFKEDLINMFNREYANRPKSRIAFMQGIGNLNRLIQNAPFDS